MPATPISAATRYFQRGVTAVVFATTVANKAAPTRVEINAGTSWQNELAAIDGWVVQGEDIETPDLGTVFTSKIPGPTSVDDSSITLYASETTNDVRTQAPRGTAGFIMLMYGGDVSGRRMNVYPIRVKSVGPSVSTDDEAATIAVSFSITGEPAENVLIPA